MNNITSPQNKLLKQLKKLSSSQKERNKTNLTILEGIHLAESYLQQVGAPQQCLFAEDALHDSEVKKIIEGCQASSVECIQISKALFKEISVVENGIGLIFVITIPKISATEQLNESAVLLENVQDPGNVGTILRTAAAAGVKKIYCSAGTASAWSPKVLRAGMAAQFALDVFENVDLVKLIQSSDIQVLATTLSAKTTIYEAELAQKTAWIIGNEGSGVSRELLELGVKEVIIPQAAGVESLNASAAAAICLFEQVRQQSSLTE